MLTQAHLPILQNARALIDSGEFTYICNAVSYGARDAVGYCRETVDQVVNAICDGLRGVSYVASASLDHWLAAQPGIENYHTRKGTMRLARLAWLDRLIADIEKE